MRAPLALALLALAGAPALAADAPSAELFGGYSYTKNGDQALNGGEASLAVELARWIGAEADVSAHYGSARGTHTRRLFLMGGPRFAYRGSGFTIFTHYLAGGVRSFQVSSHEDEHANRSLRVALELTPGAELTLEPGELAAIFYRGLAASNQDFREVTRMFPPSAIEVRAHACGTGPFEGADIRVKQKYIAGS